MLPGMIQIHDLNGSGKVLVGQIPDPDSPVSNDHFERGPLPTSAPSLGIDAEAELFGGFDGSYVGGGVGVADGPAFLVHGGLREHAAELALACAGALSLDPAGASLGFGGHDRNLDAVHQHIHFRNVLFANHWQDELFSATDFLLVLLGDLRANGLGGAFDGFGGDVQTGEQFIGSHPGAKGIPLPPTASMRLTPGEDSRPATPSSASAGCCPFEQTAHV